MQDKRIPTLQIAKKKEEKSLQKKFKGYQCIEQSATAILPPSLSSQPTTTTLTATINALQQLAKSQ